jgi:hypothetical protein
MMQGNNVSTGSGGIGLEGFSTFSSGVAVPGRSICVGSRR